MRKLDTRKIEIARNILKVLYVTTEVLYQVLTEVFDNNTSDNYIENNETYEYWRYLSYEDQKDYFENNEYLNIYTDEFYEDDRERTARNMQKIADKLGRQFTNKNSKY